jgi:hypothetical protein
VTPTLSLSKLSCNASQQCIPYFFARCKLKGVNLLLYIIHLLLNRCINRNPRSQWDTLSQCKSTILDFVGAPVVNNGVRLSAVKFMQRVILVQTRGIADPRVCLSMPFDHPHSQITFPSDAKQKRSKYLKLWGRSSIYISLSVGGGGRKIIRKGDHDFVFQPVSYSFFIKHGLVYLPSSQKCRRTLCHPQ